MDKEKKKQIVDQLLETFRSAGDLALKLRKEGLKKEQIQHAIKIASVINAAAQILDIE